MSGLTPVGGAIGGERECLLERLAEDVRRHHKAVERHARSMLDEAIAAGEALIEAKALLRHGEFDAFKTLCGVGRSSASVYMKLAREKSSAGVLEADSIRGALAALGEKEKEPKKASPRDWFSKSVAWPWQEDPYLPVYSRSVAVESAERVLREQLRLCVGVRGGSLVAQLRRRDLGDPSVEHDFGPPYSCDAALREIPAEELRALRALVDEALREREERLAARASLNGGAS
jgi:hypothetical protein